ncbi:hypothetical protein FHL15_005451 [Xylaria flabelliformis]|uniref:Uncharacterized protein n=1 Tax=Xylaria flabelliformis TaxID=2512241 RepID=A0A553I0R5_9PEZI|nr:hypothetical protein FHL15_005451 [Xylaria flabelliformis]
MYQACTLVCCLYKGSVGSQVAVSIDIFATEHPRVDNEPEIDGSIYIKGLRYLVESGQTGQELLLDILEGGRRSVDRFRLSTALDWELEEHELSENATETYSLPIPLFVDTTAASDIVSREHKVTTYHNPRPLLDRAIWKGCDVDAIPIPAYVCITEDLEPHIRKLEAIWGLWLDLDKEHRVLKFRSKERKVRREFDDMISDRHRQEFRLIFLKYIQRCRLEKRSKDFMEYHTTFYRHKTDDNRKRSEGIAKHEFSFVSKGHKEGW